MDANQSPSYAPLSGAEEALRIVEIHELIKRLDSEGVPLGMLTRRAEGTVQVVLFTSLDLPKDEGMTTFIGYDAAITHLQALLNEAWQARGESDGGR